MTDRKVILMVLWALSIYALTSLVFLGSIVMMLVLFHITISSEIMAVLALITNPMSASLGGLTAMLVSTRSSPPDPPAMPGTIIEPEAPVVPQPTPQGTDLLRDLLERYGNDGGGS